MPREVLPMDTEISDLSDFEIGIYSQIQARGDDNRQVPDRYAGAAPPRDYDHKYNSHTGNVGFGDVWQTHRLDIEEFQVIYAFRLPTIYKADEIQKILAHASGETPPEDAVEPLSSEAELYIHEFDEHGHGNIARTLFNQNKEGRIIKSRVTLFDAGVGMGLTEFHRPLKKPEMAKLETVIENPEENMVALRGLIKLTGREKRMARKAHEDHEKREKEYEARLRSLDEAQRAIPPDILIR